MFSNRTNWKLDENAYARALHRQQENGRTLLDLTVSNPTVCGFRCDDAAILAALRNASALRYEPDPKGLPAARAAVARYYEEKASAMRIDPEWLILTTGTSEGYSFLFRLLCDPGDEVLIAYPSYPLFEHLAVIQDVNLRPFRLVYDHGWQIDFHALQEAIGARTRAILLVHPNNPTGNFVAAGEAAQLNAICHRHNLALVVDEVFLDYDLHLAATKRQKHGSFISNTSTLTFVLSGLSKISALPQMKVGWIAAAGPDALVHDALARLEIIADTYLSLSAPAQHALPVLLAQRRTMQSQLKERIRQNLLRLDKELARQSLVSRLEIEGGWYVVLRVPAVRSDEELVVRLLEERGVVVHPGHFYEFPSEGYVVVSLLTLPDEFETGVRHVLACVDSL